MATNKFFNNFQNPQEQDLIRSLNREAIRIKGKDVQYLRRSMLAEDKLYGEDILSQFTQYFTFEIYIKSFTNFDGRGDILSSIGLEILDELVLTVAVDVFQEALESISLSRPMEGDLIYLPFAPGKKMLWEIHKVEDKAVFFNLGELYTIDIHCNLYKFSEETINVDHEEITELVQSLTYTIQIELDAGAGDYQVGEVVYQGTSFGAATFKAIVIGWNDTTDKLLVNSVVGKCAVGTPLIGEDSDTSRDVSGINTLDDKNDKNDNNLIEELSDDVIDRGEKSPFGDI